MASNSPFQIGNCIAFKDLNESEPKIIRILPDDNIPLIASRSSPLPLTDRILWELGFLQTQYGFQQVPLFIKGHYPKTYEIWYSSLLNQQGMEQIAFVHDIQNYSLQVMQQDLLDKIVDKFIGKTYKEWQNLFF